MDIPNIAPLQMARTNPAHQGNIPINSGAPLNDIPNAAKDSLQRSQKSFEDYLTGALKSMNNQQLDVSALQQQVITDPDSVDIHDVTIAVSKAKMSLNLAQSVIDRLIQGWNEVTTTR